jgi:hypothetical protein
LQFSVALWTEITIPYGLDIVFTLLSQGVMLAIALIMAKTCRVSLTKGGGDYAEKPYGSQIGAIFLLLLGVTWVVGPLSDVQTPDSNKYAHAPYGHLEEWANIRRAFYMAAADDKQWYATSMPAGELPAIRWEDGSLMATDRVIFDALVPGEGVTVRGTYVDGETAYLDGYAAITETKVGNGRIIVLGAQLAREDYIRVIKQIAAECDIYPIAEGSENILNSRLSGEYGEVFTAIESLGRSGWTTAPFDGEDILSGKTFKKDERIEMNPYDCLFIKQS